MSKYTPELIAVNWGDRNREIEYQWVGLTDPEAPTMVFLHEGLGSVRHWQQWPHQLCQHLGYRGLVYSRYAYGNSTSRPTDEIWQNDYLHTEAQQALPALLNALDINQPVCLFGHSDGATIALLYAAMPHNLAKNLIILAPHLYAEPMTTAGVQQAIEWYKKGNLKTRLARYHANADSAFWGWAGVWGNEHSLSSWNIEQDIQSISCPVLTIQGAEDEYATLAQVYDVKKNIPHAEICILKDCRHSPHIDLPEIVTQHIQDFLIKGSSSTP